MFTKEKIRELRKLLDWSGSKLALYLGVVENTVRRWEMGDRHPTYKMMIKLNELEEKAKKDVAAKSANGKSVVFSGPSAKPVTPTQHMAANVDAILKKRYRHEDTTLEGRLEALNVHGAMTFHIYDILTDAKTVCVFKEELYADAYAALRKRVAVTGRAKYNRAGHAVSIEVESLRQLRPSSELPHFREGEAIDITGGMDSAEYVRRTRDAE